MMLHFIKQLEEQDAIIAADSDVAYFHHLLCKAEMLLKTTVAGLVAAIEDDSDRHRYRQLHCLVRADGVGEWSRALDEVLTGPTANHLAHDAQVEQRELTQKLGAGNWQFEAVSQLDSCLRILEPGRPGLPIKIDGRRWFALFAELRNRTRGHGATKPHQCSSMIPVLKSSIDTVLSEFHLFGRQWAYLHRNFSGRYKVVPVSEQIDLFGVYKSSRALSMDVLSDGVYVWFERPRKVDLIVADSDVSDVYLPNGKFSGKSIEVISYATNTTISVDASPYLPPPGPLPISETQGHDRLEVQGESFSNVPLPNPTYVHRPRLERELIELLIDERNPVTTLTGRGGIGKTSLALSVLQSVAKEGRFSATLWFSSRDIDLLAEGPKLVRPHHLNERDIAREFRSLVGTLVAVDDNIKPVEYLSNSLQKSPIGPPILFIFDNFETVTNPIDLYNWLNAHIRLPNKILITTRTRSFKADYPLEVFGMEEDEADELINNTARELHIENLVTPTARRQLHSEAEGHPYVLKILLGELARTKSLTQINRIVASKDQILDALFERTYTTLSPAAQQVFLTLCSWRSTLPRIALEAVMLRPANEKLDVEEAIDELSQCSFIEVIGGESEEGFIVVPLAAAVFGKKKLSVSPYKVAVEANMELLLYFGAGQRTDMRHGVEPRVRRFFSRVAEKAGNSPEVLLDYVPILEYMASRLSTAWLWLATLYEESGLEDGMERAKNALRRYLENGDHSPSELAMVWNRLASLCRKSGDPDGEVQALIEIAQLPHISIQILSNIINKWNGQKQQVLKMAGDERFLIGKKLLAIAEERIAEAEATDCSRIAWLALSLEEGEKAREITKHGLSLDPSNDYCLNLAEHLGVLPIPQQEAE